MSPRAFITFALIFNIAIAGLVIGLAHVKPGGLRAQAEARR